MSKVFVWCCPSGIGSDVIGYALAEDGTDLAYHISSNESFSKHDMGVTSNWHHKEYKEHYPNGFEVVWVDDPQSNDEFIAAFSLRSESSLISHAPCDGDSFA